MTPKKIVVLGSFNMDMIVVSDRLPKPGETVLGGKFSTAAGGKGANQAVGAARAGGNVAFIARVGADVFGDQAVAGLIKDHINVDHVLRDRASASGVALILVSKNGENSISVASGANSRVSRADVQRAGSVIAKAGFLVTQLETPLPTVRAAVAFAAGKGVPVILNPAPAQPLPDSLLKKVSILTPNETEAELLTGVKVTGPEAARKAGRILLKRGVSTAILTLGARGAWIATRDFEQLVPGFKVKAVDTTAAGDTFNGALAVALVEGQTLVQAVRFANAAAALSVTKRGAQPSVPRRTQIEALLRASISTD